MSHMVHVVVLALATFVSSTAAADMMRPMPANGVHVKAIFGGDGRSTLQSRSYAFIVKLLDGHGRFVCSGSVIAGHTVMSAAHCTGYSGGEFPRPMRSISFVETADGARFRVNRSCVSPEYEGVTYPGGLQHIGDITPDVALVTTYDRIADVTGTVAVSRNLDDGDRVFLAGYHSDAPGVLRGQSCVAHRYGSIWVYDRIEHHCDSVSSGGSPLLQKRGDGSFAVVGVHSGTAEDGSTSYGALMGGEEAVDDFIATAWSKTPLTAGVEQAMALECSERCVRKRPSDKIWRHQGSPHHGHQQR